MCLPSHYKCDGQRQCDHGEDEDPSLCGGEATVLTLRRHAHAIYREFFQLLKLKISLGKLGYFKYFSSKHTLWIVGTR